MAAALAAQLRAQLTLHQVHQEGLGTLQVAHPGQGRGLTGAIQYTNT